MFTQDNQPAFDTSALDAQLADIKPIQYTAEAQSSTPGVPSNLELIDETQELLDTEEVQDTETEETTDEQAEVLENPEFAAQFKQAFGIEPAEAIETINSLRAFQEEMSLMRNWGVSPSEYDSRISQVREFYQGLPDDKKPEFNSVQGAIAIWNHLQQTNPTQKYTAKVKPGQTKVNKATPKEIVIKKSDVLKMSAEEYKRNLPVIQAATLGRKGYKFVEDV